MPTVPTTQARSRPRPDPDNLLMVAAAMHAEGKFAPPPPPKKQEEVP